MSNKVNIEDYEIWKQKNFDFLSIYHLLLDKNEDEENDKKFLLELKEYHHSLFYPILQYCIDVLNSYDKDKLKEMHLKIGFNQSMQIYVSLNRQICDLFFSEKEDFIHGQNIDIKEGKNIFNIKSTYENNIKTANENYKEYFDIPLEEPKDSAKKQ